MLTLTVAFFSVSLVAEGTAVALLFREAGGAQRSLRKWRDANPNNNENGSFGQTLLLNEIMEGLLGSPRTRFTAACLIAGGLIAGAAGNFTSLAL